MATLRGHQKGWFSRARPIYACIQQLASTWGSSYINAISYTDWPAAGARVNHIFEQLPPTQRKSITGEFGAAICHQFSQKILDIPHLINLEKLNPQIVSVLPSHRKKDPDFVGQDRRGGWHVLEAKGVAKRSAGNEAYALRSSIKEGKAQVQAIQSINGHKPLTRSVCASLLLSGGIELTVEDPEVNPDTRIEFSEYESRLMYYRPFLPLTGVVHSAFQTSSVVDGVDFVFPIYLEPILGFRIGIARDVLTRIFSNFEPGLPSLSPAFNERESDRYSIGIDGIILEELEAPV